MGYFRSRIAAMSPRKNNLTNTKYREFVLIQNGTDRRKVST